MSSETGTTATQDAPAAPATAEPAPSASSEAPAAAPEAPQTPVADTAELVDWKARHDTLEKERIPVLMSERDRASNEAKSYRERAQSIAQEYEGWIELGASRGLTAEQLLAHIRGDKETKEARQRDTQALQAETVGAINSLYRAGENDFAKFIEGLVDVAKATNQPLPRITADALPAYRKTYEANRGQSTSAATAAAVATPTVKTPPQVPAPAGSPSAPEPAWKGPKTKPKDLLARAFGGRS